MKKINIAICTYKRTELLKKCLLSLLKIAEPADTEITLTIVDNDDQTTAKAVVNELADNSSFPLFYYCEQKRGIPCARNRAIEETHKLGANYLVFIDDDERAEPDWLQKLYDFSVSQGGDIIVSGHVVSELPAQTPDNIRALFNQKNRLTGTRLTSCATNNVLIPVFVTKELGLRFDESSPLTGGTDTIFFCNAVDAGVTILKCREAIVRETVPLSRTKIKWLSKRKYRSGITAAWRKRQNGRAALSIVFSSLLQIIFEMFKCGFNTVLLRKTRRNETWLRACRSAGVLTGVLGGKVDSYKKIDK